jgi:hypothetical protein
MVLETESINSTKFIQFNDIESLNAVGADDWKALKRRNRIFRKK